MTVERLGAQASDTPLDQIDSLLQGVDHGNPVVQNLLAQRSAYEKDPQGVDSWPALQFAILRVRVQVLGETMQDILSTASKPSASVA